MSESRIIQSSRWILMITNLLVLVIGSLLSSYVTERDNKKAMGMGGLVVGIVHMIWALICIITTTCSLGVICTNSICLHVIAAHSLCIPLFLGCLTLENWIIEKNRKSSEDPSMVEITLLASLDSIWVFEVAIHLLIGFALGFQPSETTTTANFASNFASNPAPSGATTSDGGAFVPLAQVPPIEEIDEDEEKSEEDEEQEKNLQAGAQTVGGFDRSLSSNIRTSPGYISGSGVQYRSTSYTSSFQQNNLSGDSPRNNNTNSSINSDAVLMRPLSEDRQRLVQQMPGHYHGAITALGSGPGAVPPLATPKDTGV